MPKVDQSLDLIPPNCEAEASPFLMYQVPRSTQKAGPKSHNLLFVHGSSYIGKITEYKREDAEQEKNVSFNQDHTTEQPCSKNTITQLSDTLNKSS